MPLDNLFDRLDSELEEYRWRVRADWTLRFCLWPRRCAISGRRIWLKQGYRGTNWLTGPGDPIPLERWHDKDYHLVWLLEG